MTEAVVSNTLRNLRLISEREQAAAGDNRTTSTLRASILRDLKGTLEILQGLAENRDKATITKTPIDWSAINWFARLWVEDVRRFCYDVDDLLSRLEIINGGHAAAGIMVIIARLVSYLCTCFGCCDNSDNIYSKLKELSDQKNANLNCDSLEEVEISIRRCEPWRETASIFNPKKVVGREEEKRRLIDMLVMKQIDESDSPRRETVDDQCRLHIITIVGHAGIGKTMLAKLVYADEGIVDHFECCIWVNLTNPRPDEMSIVKSILWQLAPIVGQDHSGEHGTMMAELARRIAGKRLLVVLDDVGEEHLVDLLNPIIATLESAGSKQSRVLVTTRNMSIAGSLATSGDKILSLGECPADDCWEIFCKRASKGLWGDKEQLYYRELYKSAVVKRCRGVPFIASEFGEKLVRYGRSLSSRESWIFHPLLSSDVSFLLPTYIHLPPAIRLCFSYCAVLPCGFRILDEKLIRLWMAQDYLNTESSGEDNPEAVGEKYIQYLVTRSLLRVAKEKIDDGSSSGGRLLEMPDVIYDLTKICASSECLRMHNYERRFHHPVFDLLIRNPQAHDWVNVPSETIHMSIVPSEGFQFPKLISFEDHSRLRSLTVQSTRSLGGVVISTEKLSSLFSYLTSLRSLDLTDCTFKELPSTIRNLVLLRLLILSGNSDLEELPEEICDLPKLMTLDINSCESLKTLPKGIGKLVSLVHLCNFIPSSSRTKLYLPRGISKLTRLRTLTMFIVGCGHHGDKKKSSSASLADLGSLNKLRGGLCINGLGELYVDVSEAYEAQLHRKEGITRLELNFQRDEEKKGNNKIVALDHDESVIEALRPHPNLVELTIGMYRGHKFAPTWLLGLPKLRSLSLVDCPYLEELPEELFEGIDEVKVSLCPLLEQRYSGGGGGEEDWAKVDRKLKIKGTDSI